MEPLPPICHCGSDLPLRANRNGTTIICPEADLSVSWHSEEVVYIYTVFPVSELQLVASHSMWVHSPARRQVIAGNGYPSTCPSILH